MLRQSLRHSSLPAKYLLLRQDTSLTVYSACIVLSSDVGVQAGKGLSFCYVL